MMTIVASSTESVRTGEPIQPITWQESLKRAIRDPVQLCRLLRLESRYEEAAQQAAESFPVFVPEEYLSKIQPGDPNDPLLRQILPLAEESGQVEGFFLDPVGDGPAKLEAGLLQKYQGRVLLITTGACAVHCRYCFRRHYPYSPGPRSPDQWEPALQRIEDDPSIEEVILSGGDPLTLVDEHLSVLADRLDKIRHLRRLRIHTRLPIMIPQRVDDLLLGWLGQRRLTTVVVVHANHPAELDEAVLAALSRLVDSGLVVLNQSVLLRGVNDHVDDLVELSQRLIDRRVLPYYLHQLDRVAGAAHFEVPKERGIQLIEQMRARLPGYAVPRYVEEIAGQDNKIVLA